MQARHHPPVLAGACRQITLAQLNGERQEDTGTTINRNSPEP
jgi:hypothetical protein